MLVYQCYHLVHYLTLTVQNFDDTLLVRLRIVTLANLPMPVNVHDLAARAPGDVACAQLRRLGYKLCKLPLRLLIIPVDRLELDQT